MKTHDQFLDLLELEPLGSTVQLNVSRHGKKIQIPFELQAARED